MPKEDEKKIKKIKELFSEFENLIDELEKKELEIIKKSINKKDENKLEKIRKTINSLKE